MGKEIWRPTQIKGYEVSSHGRVRSLDRFVPTKCPHPRGQDCKCTKGKYLKGRILKISYCGGGKKGGVYSFVNCGRGHPCLVHRLVALAFVPNPRDKPEVNHIDGDKRNNHYKNLEWSTQSENMLHSFKIGTHTPNITHHLPPKGVTIIYKGGGKTTIRGKRGGS